MRQLLFAVPLCSLFALQACTPQPQAEAHTRPTPAAFDPATAKAVLDSMNVHYHDRFNDSTEAYFAAHYTADACVFAPNMPRVCGIGPITTYYWNKGDNRTLTLDIQGEEVTGTAQEVTEVGSYRVIDDEGTELDKGKFIATFRQVDGAWKVHREIWNSDLPPLLPPPSVQPHA